jgi:Family of unknown function (DUF5631)/Family of unknown function (DUF5632)
VAVFGRNTARQRLRRATRESLKIPAFSSPVDCTPWVTGGLWPAELSTVTPETAPLVKYLRADLQRIVNSANEELMSIRRSGLADPLRQEEEARVIDAARAFAVRRVESTVRHLRKVTSELRAEYRPLNGIDGADGVEDTEKIPRFRVLPRKPPEVDEPTDSSAQQAPESSEEDRRQPTVVDEHDSPTELIEAVEQPAPTVEPEIVEPETVEPEAVEQEIVEPETVEPETVEQEIIEPETVEQEIIEPETVEPETAEQEIIEPETVEQETAEPEVAGSQFAEPEDLAPLYPSDADDTEVLEEIATVLQEIATLAETPLEQLTDGPATDSLADLPVEEPPSQPPVAAAVLDVPVDDALTMSYPTPLLESGWERKRLERLLKFVARQEPGLRWAIGERADGTTLLVTDLAHGWIPPGITLPTDVRLLGPDRRRGNAAALLSETTLSMAYAPGDPLGWAADYEVTDTSSQPRELPAVDDLGWLLSEATHWRDGLPRMIHTFAKAGAGGTGIDDQEIDLLRVYLDTSRYQLLAQYPDVDAALLLNCLLLAATEGIATGNPVSANYHFAWFQVLSAPPASGWRASP